MPTPSYDTIKDFIIPEVFMPYLQQKTVDHCAFLRSGIATSDSGIEITKGGRTVNLPFNKILDGEDEVVSTSEGVTINELSTFADIAAVHGRAVGYKWNNFAAVMANNDPESVIANQLGENWAVNLEAVLTSSLEGVFASESMKDSVLDRSKTVLKEADLIDAMFLLGDNFQKIGAIAMHSMVLAEMRKNDYLDKNQVLSDKTLDMPRYMGKEIIIDDLLVPNKDGVYPVYFFGKGSVAFNENPKYCTVKTDEDIETDYVEIVSRRLFTMHVRGVRWIGNAKGETPTNAELKVGTNWELVDNRKNVAVTKLLCRVSPKDTSAAA